MQIEQWTRYRAKDHRRLEAVVSSFTLPILRRYLRDIDSTTNFYEIFTRKRNKLDPIRSRNVYEKRLSNRNVIRDKDIRLNSYPIDYGIDTLVEKNMSNYRCLVRCNRNLPRFFPHSTHGRTIVSREIDHSRFYRDWKRNEIACISLPDTWTHRYISSTRKFSRSEANNFVDAKKEKKEIYIYNEASHKVRRKITARRRRVK